MPWTFSFMWSSLVVFPSFLFFQQYPSFLYFTFFLLYRMMLPFFGLRHKAPSRESDNSNTTTDLMQSLSDGCDALSLV